mmetsp:Transcript_26206/g.56555  ORF Transcript_26206/g.56555 Transcript_26206/m.56555 type:complete len:107 (+) Transcript_26206:520-840(+)
MIHSASATAIARRCRHCLLLQPQPPPATPPLSRSWPLAPPLFLLSNTFQTNVPGAASQDVIFVDDSWDHIQGAHSVCRTLHVVSRKGMTDEQMSGIQQAAFGVPPS